MRLQIGDLFKGQGGRPEAEGWHRIHSPSSRLGCLLAGLAGFLFPTALFLWLIVMSLLALPRGADAPADLSTPWGAVAWALLLYIPMHELLHAVWHPQQGLSPQTIAIVWPAKLRFGVYYEGCMTRRRWLVMRMAPFVALSVVPAGVLAVLQYVSAPLAVQVFLQVLMLVNGIGSGGDIVALMWVCAQVPASSQICTLGGKAYWRRLARVDQGMASL